MTAATLERAYTEPLDQQDGSPLLHPPSPKHRERKPGAMLAEGLRMSPADWPYGKATTSVSPTGGSAGTDRFEHRPVMLDEVVDIFSAVPAGVVMDATIGGGGHARALLQAFPQLRVVGIDQDEEAVVSARAALAPFGGRATVVKGRFDHSSQVLDDLGTGPLSGVLFDLGVSSPQFDRPERGFSYRFDAALDMRMDRSQALTAAQLVNESTEADLARLFRDNGETRFAHRIAAAIVNAASGADHGQAGRCSQLGGAGGGPPPRSPGQAGLPGSAGGGELRARDPAGRDRRGHRAALTGRPDSRDRVPLGGRQGGQGAAGQCGHRWVHLPAGPPLRVRGHGSRPTSQPGRPQGVGRGSVR